MNTQTVVPTPRALPSPVVVLGPLLLTKTSSVTRLADSGDVAPERLKLAATQVTVVLKEILEQRGYRHSGINE
jgi:hypothetical protein